MAPQNAARMQQPGVVPLPPELVRQTNIFRAEHMEIVRENGEMREKLEAALRENEQLKKGNRRVKNSGKRDDGVQFEAECRKMRKENQALVAEQGKLKADLRSSKRRLADEQNWSRRLSEQNSRLEVLSQVNKGKIHTLAQHLGLREKQLKAKDLEIQNLNSKLKIMGNAQRVYQNQSPQSRKLPQAVKRGGQLEMEMKREVPSWIGLDTGHQPPLGERKQCASGADSLTQINHGSTTQYQEIGENHKPTTGYGPQKADWIFWSTADEYSGAEVVSQVEKLNSEMFQVAASMADELDLENLMNGGGQELDNVRVTEAIAKTAKIIGPQLTSMLATSNSQYVDIIMQTAFQTAVLMHIQRIISSWLLWDEKKNRTLRNIHKRLQDSKPQPVSGRWRQLTKASVRSIKRIDEHDLLPLLIGALTNIVIATGYNLNQATVKEMFMRFSPHLGEIIKLALEVNTMIGEGITSCDFEVTFVPHDTPYDPEYMETVYRGSSPIHGKESVISTVDLGLIKVERVSKPEVHTKELVLLKPKVLLQCMYLVLWDCAIHRRHSSENRQVSSK